MFRLTRQVRFAIDPAVEPAGVRGGGNGHAGSPAIASLASRFFAIDLTLEGPLDPQSSYLRNIRDIDHAVRAIAVPIVAERLRSAGPTDAGFDLPATLLAALRDRFGDARLVELAVALSPFTFISARADEVPMVRLSHRFEFSAAHRLHNPTLSDADNVATFGKCNNPHGHGHNYELQVTIAGEVGPDGQILPLAALEQLVDEAVIRPFDHKHLNLEVEPFDRLNPSVENIARVIFERLGPRVADRRARLASVVVWETPKTFAEYTG
jgi:6-pyruvoyltetrahydropterin/6-carboxytetrahydropterin synthase